MGITKNKQSQQTINKMTGNAYPGKRISSCTELTEGFCNVAYLITFQDGEKKILKIAAADNHGYMSNEINMMTAEVSAMQLLQDKLSAKVAKVDLHDNSKTICSGEYFFMDCLDGENYFHLKNRLSEKEQQNLDFQIGHLVREFTNISNDFFGLLGDVEHRFPSLYELIHYMLNNVIRDADRKAVKYFISGNKLLALLERDRYIFDQVTTPCLVHYDLWEGNIFVKDMQVHGLIDWERALWGDPLMEDRFRRHTRNSDFLKGFGIESFTDAQQRRIYWYDIILYLTMMTEGIYREYEDDSQYRWVAPLFQASLTELM